MKAGEPPTFSVLIRTHQLAETVGDAVESALAQTLPPFEVVVCDDGSTDGTEDVLRPYGDRIVYLRGESLGPAGAFNRALDAATGDFVVVLDADDVFEPERVEALSELAAARPDLDIVTTDAAWGSDGEIVGRFNREANPFEVEDQRAVIVERCFIVAPGARRTAVLAVGGQDARLHAAADWDCWMRMILGGSKAGSVDEPLLRYRLREESTSGHRSARSWSACTCWRTSSGIPPCRPRIARGSALPGRHRATLALAEAYEAAGRAAPTPAPGPRSRPRAGAREQDARASGAAPAAPSRSGRGSSSGSASLHASCAATSRARMSSGPAIPPHAEHEPPRTRRHRGAAVLRGGVWNLVGLFVPQLALLAVSIAAARYLGRDQFGRQSFIAFVEVTTLTLCAAGLPLALARFAGDAVGRGKQGVVRGLARWVGRMTVILGLAGAGVLAGIGLAGATPRAAWLLAASVVLLGTVQRIPSAVLNGLQLWRGPSLVGVVMAVAMAVAGILVLAAGGGIVGMFAVEAVAAVVSLAWLWLVSRRAQVPLGPPVPVEPPLKQEFLRYAFVASLGVVLTLIVWRRSEFLFLNHYSSDSEIALYSVAFSAVAALLLIPQALVGVVLPAVANLLGAGATDHIRWGFERAIRLLLLLTLPMTAVSIALGPQTLRLVYGENFGGAGTVVIVLLAPIPLVTLINLSKVVLAGMGRQWFQLSTGAIGAAVNVGLDFLLIPGHAALGAAFANCGGQLVSGLPVLVYAWRRIGVRQWAPPALARTVLVSVGAGLSGWLVQRWLGGALGVLIGLGAATATFLVLAAWLRILTAEDAVWLEKALGRPTAAASRAQSGCAPIRARRRRRDEAGPSSRPPTAGLHPGPSRRSAC